MVRKLTKTEFIQRSLHVHGIKYNYDFVEYIGINVKVMIECSVHGFLEQSPSNHLAGRGCYNCGRDLQRSKKVSTTEKFIEQAIQN
jgi:hypothetical protein